MKALDLCSGIGGFALGFERAGIETVAFCELDRYCRMVLRKNFPYCKIHFDLRGLDGRAYRGIDIVSAGFPCQPHSLAGRRRGTQDDRFLWPCVLRIVRDSKARWFVGENVPGIDDKREMVLDRVLSDLESEGHETRTFEIPACGKGAPHKRARIVIVVNRPGRQPQGHVGESAQGRAAGPTFAGDLANRAGLGFQVGACAESGAQDRRATYGNSDVGNHHGDECERQRLSGRPRRQQNPHFDGTGESWLICPDGKARRVKSGVRLLAHGIPGRMERIKSLGNAFLPQIAEEIGLAIMAAERQ